MSRRQKNTTLSNSAGSIRQGCIVERYTIGGTVLRIMKSGIAKQWDPAHAPCWLNLNFSGKAKASASWILGSPLTQ